MHCPPYIIFEANIKIHNKKHGAYTTRYKVLNAINTLYNHTYTDRIFVFRFKTIYSVNQNEFDLEISVDSGGEVHREHVPYIFTITHNLSLVHYPMNN